MNSFKPEMNLEDAKEFLRQIEGDKVYNVFPIEMGELSKVFSFSEDDRDFVIHFKSNRDSLDKAKYMHDSYAVYGIPIPRVIGIGSFRQVHYSISEKVPGKPIINFCEKDIPAVLDKLAEEFARINAIEIEKGNGFGWISPSGRAHFCAWSECLIDFFKIEEGGFYGDWTKLYEDSFLERDLCEDIFAKMLELAKYFPGEPYLVHGDFHLGNMLSDGSRITGIVDWEQAMYGDFMFDLGTFHFWNPQFQFPQRVRDSWERKGDKITFFDERLLCYQLFKGLDGLRFLQKRTTPRVISMLKINYWSYLNEKVIIMVFA